MTTIGAELRKHRERRGLTLRQLAELTGLAYTTLGAYERGRFDVPIANLRMIAGVLGLTVEIHLRPFDENGPVDEVTPAQGALLELVHRRIRGMSETDVGIISTLLDRMASK
jgi:transcriptional regulator with XRE-family HTH domain